MNPHPEYRVLMLFRAVSLSRKRQPSASSRSSKVDPKSARAKLISLGSNFTVSWRSA